MADKSVLVKVNAFTPNATEAIPGGVLRVETPAGVLLEAIPLTRPAGALPAIAPIMPSFSDAYTAVVPASRVQTGLRLTAVLDNEQPGTTVTPRVGGGVSIRVVAVPVRIGELVGQVVPGIGQYLQARMPVASVSVQTRTSYTSTSVTSVPTDSWAQAFSSVWVELNDLQMLEASIGSRTYYYGFMPKRVNAGTIGLSSRPGYAALGFDLPSNPAAVLRTVAHELGHSLNLQHAPCGAAQDPDPQYPYPNAQLAGGGLPAVWGYLADTRSFVDPRVSSRHDLMSYCDGDTFSDYSYRVMQAYLSPVDARASMVVPQDLILISGRIGAGQVTLSPIKALWGFVGEPKAGPYTLRMLTSQGMVDYPFEAQQLEHGDGAEFFGFKVAHPGHISQLSILKNGVTLMSRSAKSTQGVSLPAVQVLPANGQLNLTWDGARYPYLTVTHQGDRRMTLAQDLQGGTANVSAAGLPAGGSFEFSLSDGLNSVRLNQPR